MNSQFYNILIKNPDLKDVSEYLKEPLSTLSQLDEAISKSKKDIISNQISTKINKLKYKYLPDLFNNYINLDLEYRNNVVIKTEHINNTLVDYTAKDILLKNLGKLIEEIALLKKQIIENYGNDFLQSKQTSNYNVCNLEIENQKDNLLNKNLHKSMSTEKAFIKKNHNKPKKTPSLLSSIFDEFLYFLQSDIGFAIMFVIFASIGVYNVYDKVAENNAKEFTIENIQEFSQAIHKLYPQKNYINLNEKVLYEKGIMKNNYLEGHYINNFGGYTTIKPISMERINDNFAIKNTNIPSRACYKMAIKLQQDHPKLLKVNDTIVIKDGFIDSNQDNLLEACAYAANTLTVIPND